MSVNNTVARTRSLFCAACLALAATPGPNMLFLVSRTLAQGRAAGFISLAGTSSGFALHAIAAALGLSALLAAVRQRLAPLNEKRRQLAEKVGRKLGV